MLSWAAARARRIDSRRLASPRWQVRRELEERFLAYYGHIENVREGFLGMVRNHQRLQGELSHHLSWKAVELSDEDPVYNELHNHIRTLANENAELKREIALIRAQARSASTPSTPSLTPAPSYPRGGAQTARARDTAVGRSVHLRVPQMLHRRQRRARGRGSGGGEEETPEDEDPRGSHAR